MDAFKDEFVPNIQSANKTNYSQWRNSNPGEAAKWEKFRDDVIAGKKPVPPVLATKYGKALVAAGKLRMSVTDIGSVPPVGAPPTGNVFVSPGGSDTSGNGSQASPYRTLRKACTVAVAGDVIGMAPGTYVENLICVVPPKVSIAGAGGLSRTTIIRGSADPLIQVQNNSASDNLQTISGFYLDGQNKTAGAQGMNIVNCRNVTVSDVLSLDFTGNRSGVQGGALQITGSTSCTIHHSEFRNSGFVNFDPQNPYAFGSLGVGTCTSCVFHDIVTEDSEAVGFKGLPGPITNCEFYNLTCTSVWTGQVFPDADICFEFFDTTPVGCLIHHSYFESTISLTDTDPQGPLPAGQYRWEIYNNYFNIPPQSSTATVGTCIEVGVHSIHAHHNYFKGGAQAFSWIGEGPKQGHKWHHNVHDFGETSYTCIARMDNGLSGVEYYFNTYHNANSVNQLWSGPGDSPNVHDNIFSDDTPSGDRWGSAATTSTNHNAFYNFTGKGTNQLILSTQPLPLTGGFPAAYVATGPAAAYGAMEAGTFVVGPQ